MVEACGLARIFHTLESRSGTIERVSQQMRAISKTAPFCEAQSQYGSYDLTTKHGGMRLLLPKMWGGFANSPDIESAKDEV
jgi:hypothetical protein